MNSKFHFNPEAFGWEIVEIDQIASDEVFVHIKYDDYEYKGIITGDVDESDAI